MENSNEVALIPPELFRLPSMESNSIKYERQYRTAGRNLHVNDLVDYAGLQGEFRVFGPGFTEELPSLIRQDIGVIGDHTPSN